MSCLMQAHLDAIRGRQRQVHALPDRRFSIHALYPVILLQETRDDIGRFGQCVLLFPRLSACFEAPHCAHKPSPHVGGMDRSLHGM